MGTVEYWPDLETVRGLLLKDRVQRVFLMPLLTVAGIHAQQDIAGTNGNSWKSVLEEYGFECVPVLNGLADHRVFMDLWIEKLHAALQAL